MSGLQVPQFSHSLSVSMATAPLFLPGEADRALRLELQKAMGRINGLLCRQLAVFLQVLVLEPKEGWGKGSKISATLRLRVVFYTASIPRGEGESFLGGNSTSKGHFN